MTVFRTSHAPVCFDLPDGQSGDLAVKSRFVKLFVSLFDQIISLFRVIPHPLGGTYRDRHGRWVREAVDADVPLTNGADADGEVVWS
jgi:hypothetical protein